MEIVIAALFLFLHFVFGAIVVPPPDGPYGVGATQMVALTDKSREDPYSSKKEKRSVVLSAYYPVAMKGDCINWKKTDYMPDQTADIMNQGVTSFGIPKGTLNQIKLSMCDVRDRGIYLNAHAGFAKKQFPLVLFSPGNAQSRFEYSAIAQAVAAQGYVVVSMDHPYDAAVVEYPDGRLVFASPKADGQPMSEIKKLINTRADDMIFVLDQLAKTAIVKELLPNVYKNNAPPNLGHVPLYGHSAGGEAATVAIRKDSRFAGGINLDGALKGLEDEIDVDPNVAFGPPYIYFGSQDTGKNEPGLVEVWPIFNWGLQLFLKKSRYGTFSDVPLLAHILGLEPVKGDAALDFGKVPGDRAMEIMIAYIDAFFKFVLTGKEQKLLKGPSNDFPEVEYVRKGYSQ